MNRQLFILQQVLNSQHQLNQLHTAIQTYILFDFQRIWIGKRMLPLFQIAISCELMGLSWNCLFFFSPCIFARAFCNIDINPLSKQKLTSKVLTNHYKKTRENKIKVKSKKFSSLKSEIKVSMGCLPSAAQF